MSETLYGQMSLFRNITDMGSDYGVGNMSSMLQESRMASKQSIISALNKFVQAVNVMDQTVMIPSRLRDMDVCVNLNGSGPSIPVENNNQVALLSVSGTKEANLYTFYTMLNAMKQELISGGRSEHADDGAPEGGTDDQTECGCSRDSRPTAAAFRYHLTSLLGMLRQMTATANYLTSRYENDVDIGQSSSQYTSWAL